MLRSVVELCDLLRAGTTREVALRRVGLRLRDLTPAQRAEVDRAEAEGLSLHQLRLQELLTEQRIDPRYATALVRVIAEARAQAAPRLAAMRAEDEREDERGVCENDVYTWLERLSPGDVELLVSRLRRSR
jgi:hypothetical protein